MSSILRQLHAATAMLFVASLVIQVFLAGTALAGLGGSGDFRTHIDFGYTAVGLSALAVVLTAVVARVGRRDVGLSFVLLVLYVVQTVLPQSRTTVPWVAALHPVNAMLLFVLAAWYARRAWLARSARPTIG